MGFEGSRVMDECKTSTFEIEAVENVIVQVALLEGFEPQRSAEGLVENIVSQPS